MAELQLLTRAVQKPAPPLRKRVTLSNRLGTLTLSSTSPESELLKLGSRWEQIDRYRLDPILRRVGLQRREVRLQAFLYDYYHRDAPVDAMLFRLRRIINSDEPVRVVYGASDSGLWAVTDASARVLRRQPGTNHATRMQLDLVLADASGYVGAVAPAPGVAAAPKPAAPPKPTGVPDRFYVVRAGDTLSKIAVKFGGTADDWPVIAKANGIADPRKLPVGKRLRIPPL